MSLYSWFEDAPKSDRGPQNPTGRNHSPEGVDSTSIHFNLYPNVANLKNVTCAHIIEYITTRYCKSLCFYTVGCISEFTREACLLVTSQ